MNVALYARVSSVAQDVELSVASQLRALGDYALSNGHTVVREFVDEAESGRTANRPNFNRMIGEARNTPSPFDAILVWKMSRFARNREDSVLFKSFLRRRGVRVISINEPIEEGPTGRLVEGIIESIDEFYSASLAQDVTRGMREAASRGFWVSSNTPFGYRRVRVGDGARKRTRLEIEPASAAVVKEIFTWAGGGSGCKEIAVLLNRTGVPSPKGKKWGKSRIYDVLTNPVYKGTLVFGKNGRFHREAGLDPVVVEGAVPTIVDAATFDAIQSGLASRAPAKRHPRRVASSYLLSGLLYCGDCGAKMFGHAAKSGLYHYYNCGTASRTGKDECAASPVKRSRIEQRVLQRLLNVILQGPHLERLVEMTNEYIHENVRASAALLDVIEAELAKVRTRLTRQYEALETGKFSLNDLAPRIKQLRVEEVRLAAKSLESRHAAKGHKVRLIESGEILRHLNDLRKLLSTGTPLQQKTFLGSFVEKITKSGDTIEIEYTLPVPPDRSSLSGERVPRIDLSGGAGGTRTPGLFVANEALSQLSYSL